MNAELVEQVFRVIGNVAVVAMIVPLGIFILLYRARSPWRENELGIALMAQKVALLVMVLAIVAGNFLPDEFDLARIVTRALLFVAVAFFLAVDVANLWLLQAGRPNRLIFARWIYKPRDRRRRR